MRLKKGDKVYYEQNFSKDYAMSLLFPNKVYLYGTVVETNIINQKDFVKLEIPCVDGNAYIIVEKLYVRK